jgi:rhamnulokinase
MEALFAHIKTGIAQAARQFGSTLVSVGVDTWGVDYALLDAKGNLLGAISSLAEGRALTRRSFATTTFEPRDTAAWDAAYVRFKKILPP